MDLIAHWTLVCLIKNISSFVFKTIILISMDLPLVEAFVDQLQKYLAWLLITHNNPPKESMYKFMLDWVELMI